MACEPLTLTRSRRALGRVLGADDVGRLTAPVHAWTAGSQRTCCGHDLTEMRHEPFAHLSFHDVPRAMRCSECSVVVDAMQYADQATVDVRASAPKAPRGRGQHAVLDR